MTIEEIYKMKYKELEYRVSEMNKGGLVLSNQYGMLLNVTEFVSKEERMENV